MASVNASAARREVPTARVAAAPSAAETLCPSSVRPVCRRGGCLSAAARVGGRDAAPLPVLFAHTAVFPVVVEVLATSAGRLGGGPPRFPSVWFAGGGVRGTFAEFARSVTVGGGTFARGISILLLIGGCGTFPGFGAGVRAIFSFGRVFPGGTFLAAVAGCPGRFTTGVCCTITGLSALTGGRVGEPPAAMARGVGLISGCGITWARAICWGLTFTMLRSTGSELRNVFALTAVVATV